jgi:hypothetical protein
MEDGLGDVDVQRGCVYVRFRRRARFGIIGLGDPSLSEWIGFDK